MLPHGVMNMAVTLTDVMIPLNTAISMQHTIRILIIPMAIPNTISLFLKAKIITLLLLTITTQIIALY